MQKPGDAPYADVKREPNKSEVITSYNGGRGSIGWGMDRITGKIIARADGSCYFQCADGIQREVEPPSPPLNPDQMSQLRRIWNQNTPETDEGEILYQWNLYSKQVAAYVRCLKKLNQMKALAKLERSLSDQSIPRLARIRLQIERFCREIFLRLPHSRLDT